MSFENSTVFKMIFEIEGVNSFDKLFNSPFAATGISSNCAVTGISLSPEFDESGTSSEFAPENIPCPFIF